MPTRIQHSAEFDQLNKNSTDRKIVIVDDEPLIVDILKQLLTEQGMQVFAHNDPSAALAEMQNNIYDLVISDMQMPGMSGLQLYEQYTTSLSGKNIPFLFLSGDQFAMDTKKSKYPLCRFLSKPFDLDQFLNLVNLMAASAQWNETPGSSQSGYCFS